MAATAATILLRAYFGKIKITVRLMKNKKLQNITKYYLYSLIKNSFSGKILSQKRHNIILNTVCKYPSLSFSILGSHDTMLAPLHSHLKYGFG
jgi:hypothetical protein